MNLLKNRVELKNKIEEKRSNFLCNFNSIIENMERIIFCELELKRDQKIYITLDDTEYEIRRKKRDNKVINNLRVYRIGGDHRYTINKAEKYMLFRYICSWLMNKSLENVGY